jgi:hypothetical protein
MENSFRESQEAETLAKRSRQGIRRAATLLAGHGKNQQVTSTRLIETIAAGH